MSEGKVVEHGSADDVLLRPQHLYTQQLVASLPALERPAADEFTPAPVPRSAPAIPVAVA